MYKKENFKILVNYIFIKEVIKMGNLMKINLYADKKRINGRIINIKKLEETILSYNSWLKKNNREDKIESYEEFLQAQ